MIKQFKKLKLPKNKKSWQRGFIKLTKRALVTYLIIFFAFSSIVGLFLFNPFGSDETQAWYNTNWNYRQTVTATNNTSSQSNYQLQIALDTKTLIDAGKLQSDCDDIRITDSADTALTYWTELCSNTTGTNSLFWATVPTLAAGSSTFYIYYGNSAATSVSSFSSVPPGLSIGTGRDGSITISSDTNINTADSISGRTCSDTTGGDAVIYTSTANTSAASSTIALASNPSAGCLTAGDEVLIANLQGTRAANSDVGEYETARVVSISTNTLTLNRGLTNGYDGSTQKIVVQRIPNYTSVTLSNAGTDFFPSDWDTTNFRGGIMAFRANGTVTIAASTIIHANAAGYIGGIGGNTVSTGVPDAGENGESYDGSGYATIGKGGNSTLTSCGGDTVGSGRGCRGGGSSGASATSNPANGADRGGGGGGGTQGTTLLTGGGGAGGGGGYAGGGGGGGGNGSNATGGAGGTGGSTGTAGGGGGGSCLNTVVSTGAGGNAGSAGGNSNCNSTNPFSIGGTVGSGATSASGGGGANNSAGGNGAGGGGGGLYGTAALSTLFFGSGGGGGGIGVTTGPVIVNGANGADGGGIIFVNASTVSVSGGIQSNGANANTPSTGGGSGGAGAGGSVLINAGTATLGSSLVTATGGAANAAASRIPGAGGAGVGRIAVNSSSSSGTTNPTAGSTSTIPIAGAAASEQTKPGTTPVGYWKFDEGYGTTANNDGSTGSSINGTINGPTWQTENMCISGKCLNFDGSDDYVAISDSNDLDLRTEFTISTWVYTYNVPANCVSDAVASIFNKGRDSTSTYAYNLDLQECGGDSGKLGIEIYNGSTVAQALTRSAITLNRWYHVAATYDGANLKLYLNGQLESTTATTVDPGNQTSPAAIGKNANASNRYYPGRVDELKVYKKTLTADEIKSQYNLGSAVVLGTNIQNMPDALSDGLVGYWKMEEAASPSLDSSGNGGSGTWAGNVAQTTGKFGFATTYDGTGDYVEMTDNSNYSANTTNQLTVSGWINPSNVSTASDIISKGNTGQYEWSLRHTNSGAFQAVLYNSGGSTIGVATNGSNASTSTWYHVAFTADLNTNKLNLYVNGVLTTSGTISGTYTNGTSTLRTGLRSDGANGFSGKVDEARIYNRALSTTEVSQLYNWAPGPVAYWMFEEGNWTNNCSTTSVVDSSGNGLNGTSCPNSTGLSAPTGGKYGKAPNFNGSSQYVSVADNSIIEPRQISEALWINPDTVSGFDVIIQKDDDSNGYGMYMDNGTLNGFLSVNGVYSNITGGSITVNTWTHIAQTFDGTTHRLFVNGVQVNSASISGNLSHNAVGLEIGASTNNGEYFDGKIDEVRIYNYARTQGQIVQDMNASHPAPGSPVGSTVGWWKMDEGYGTTTNNYGGAGTTLSGSMTNFASPATSSSGWGNDGKFLKALNFDGSNDVVTVTNTNSIDMDTNLANFTFSSWIYADSDGEADTGQIFNKGTNTYLRVDSQDGSNNLDLECNLDRTTDTNVNIADAFVISTWNHVVCTWDGTTMKVFVNGIERGSSTSGSGGIASDANNLLIGGGTSNNFDGKIDEVKVYNSALNTSQVDLDMNRGQAQVMGALSTSSTAGNDNASTRTAQSNASEYCIPGDSSTCTGPIGDWKLDEGSGTSANDSSGNANTLALTNGPVFANGKINKDVRFDGTDDYLLNNGSTQTQFNANGSYITVEGWVNPSVTQNKVIISKGGSGSGGWTIWEQNGPISVFFKNSSSNAVSRSSSSSLANNAWTHFVVAMKTDTTGTTGNDIKIYLNGKLDQGSLTNSTAVTISTAKLKIGARGEDVSVADYFNGQIDQVTIFDYQRSAAQIAWDYNQGGPIGHWKMDECSGTAINDAAGNSLTGTWSGSSGGNTSAGTCQTPSTAWGDGVTGKRNYSLDFDGTDDLVTIASNSIMNAPTLTVSAWTYTTAVTSLKNAISRDDGSSNRDWNLGMGSSNSTYRFALWVGNTQNNAQSGTGFSTNAWHHLVGTYDGATMKLYVDGRLTASTSVAGSADTDTTSIKIGARGSQDYWTGQLDDARFYNYPLTETQVKDLYNQGAANYGPVTGAP